MATGLPDSADTAVPVEIFTAQVCLGIEYERQMFTDYGRSGLLIHCLILALTSFHAYILGHGNWTA